MRSFDERRYWRGLSMALPTLLAVSCAEANSPETNDVGGTIAMLPDVNIGHSDDPRVHFGFPIMVGTDETGSLYVHDVALGELVRLAESGEFEFLLWTRGAGPLGNVRIGSVRVVTRNDIRIWDTATNRLIVIDSLGRAGSSRQVDIGMGPRNVFGLLPNPHAGEFAGWVYEEIIPVQGGRVVARNTLIRLGPDGVVIDTLAIASAPASKVIMDGGGTRITLPVISYSDHIVWLGSSRIMRIVQDLAHRRVSITVSDAGVVQKQRTINYAPEQISRRERASMRSNALRALERLPGGQTPARRKVVLGSLSFPPHMPPVPRIAVCPSGHVWLHLIEAGVTDRWLILNPYLEVVQPVRLPCVVVSAECIEGEHLWVTMQDSLEAMYLSRHKAPFAPS
jgi:hypothetical protein